MQWRMKIFEYTVLPSVLQTPRSKDHPNSLQFPLQDKQKHIYTKVIQYSSSIITDKHHTAHPSHTAPGSPADSQRASQPDAVDSPESHNTHYAALAPAETADTTDYAAIPEAFHTGLVSHPASAGSNALASPPHQAGLQTLHSSSLRE
jgi:hypothetical protein